MRPPSPIDKAPETSTLILTNHAGHVITLDRTKIGVEKGELGKKQTVWSTDWSKVLDCPRCGGCAKRGGGHDGGHLTVYRIHPDGTWVSMVAACSCFFGAWWTRETTDPDGRVRIRAIPFADSLRDLPPGLTNQHWRCLHGFMGSKPMSYLEAAYNLPDGSAVPEQEIRMLGLGITIRKPQQHLVDQQDKAKAHVVGIIERWVEGNPPKWDPEAGENRKPEAAEQTEDRTQSWERREMEKFVPEDEEQEDLPF